MRIDSKKLCSAYALVLLLSPSLVFAAGGKGSISDLLFPWINFILYVGILYVVLRKPLAAVWQARRATILEAVEASKRANDDARVVYAAAQDRARALPQAIQEMKSRIMAETAAESAYIAQDAEARSQKILQSARDTLVGEEKAFQAELRRDFVDEVMRRAEAKLRAEVTDGRDQQLRQSSLRHIKALLH